MYALFEEIINNLINSTHGRDILRLNIPAQLTSEDSVSLSALNSAFLVILSGSKNPFYSKARALFEAAKEIPALKRAAEFYELSLELIKREIDNHPGPEKLKALAGYLSGLSDSEPRMRIIESIREVFFPEGVGIFEHKDEMREALRRKRLIRVDQHNHNPVKRPATEVLFTSNVLLTIPPKDRDIKELDLDDNLKEKLEQIMEEDQLYWYDHPIQIGVETDKNEAVYGLKGLSDALRFEKKLGTASSDERLKCLLSVSVTHKGLHFIAKDYVEEELKKAGILKDMDIYLFTEEDTRAVVEEILAPAAARYLDKKDVELLSEVFGVDGEYGRHYSFLKAIVPLWSLLMAPSIKATFKIDLDQVFPEEHLVKETGKSAFQHLMTPLWGARGRDWLGREVFLGLLAGALVNEKDIGRSLFTPDVRYPSEDITGDEVLFYSQLPQALSTEAEMMTRYNSEELDGKKACIQRYHVTGGTTGALVEALRAWRPFTPGFVGRAEDQAYLMSVLFECEKGCLRYLHKDGLIMRHDKEAFASEAIQAAWAGKTVGDYVRIIIFSFYARALGWQIEDIKAELDPFTGCFISDMPITLSVLRLSLKAAKLFNTSQAEKAEELLEVGFKRLGRLLDELKREPDFIKKSFQREKTGWDIYYDVIDALEEALKRDDPFAVRTRERMASIAKSYRLNI
ncbi:MAG: hypothetical protein GXO99_04290 [Nitrospirae bacterium]|nr:hypothetical protein [Nitrospirota bacterium]